MCMISLIVFTNIYLGHAWTFFIQIHNNKDSLWEYKLYVTNSPNEIKFHLKWKIFFSFCPLDTTSPQIILWFCLKIEQQKMYGPNRFCRLFKTWLVKASSTIPIFWKPIYIFFKNFGQIFKWSKTNQPDQFSQVFKIIMYFKRHLTFR